MQQEQEQQQQQPQRQLWWQHPQMQQQQLQQLLQWQQPAPQSPLPRFASPMNQAPKALPPSETGKDKQRKERAPWEDWEDALVLRGVEQVSRPLHRLHLACTSPAPRLHSWHC